ncbi:VIT domain-containing protein [Massilia sp. DJPM01]|uniref:VIT domain-containing protein n=1 Tax=Massilia sp. DJPM01 TaxID=3024404 RepID=UPI00259F0E68|nr:VIT domain-containing protein [Massilia sp. DJPM01]MDM5180169.1 VIT domain-containing protein [Massilia sp. DJPM01]
MLNRFLGAALLCLACPLTHASRTMSEPRPVRLMPTEAAAQPIELRQLTVSAVISGNMAQTTVRMVFYNPNPRQLEGNLQFPLLAGQQINAFALDIGGKMRPAVPVEKERGRAVFEAIVRRGVDPALLEVTEGNNFKLRVYPIMGRSTRTVELSYGEALSQHGGLATWRLPLEYGKVRDMDLTVRVNGATTAPVVDGLEPGLQFEPDAGAWQAHMRRQDFTASGNIVIRTAAGSKTRVYTEKRLGERWFLAEIPVAQVMERRTPPRIIGLLWDSSGSAEKRDINAELATLDQYFRALGQVQVRLTRLRDRPEAQQVFDIRGGNWSALRRALESTRYDGASALNDWKPQADIDQYLLMSDGLSNYGPAKAPVLAPHQSLFALTSALSADSGRLAALAERHHGQFIRIGERATDSIGALIFAPARVEHVEATGATDIQAGTGTVEGGMLRITGRLLAPDATLSVTLANGAKTDTIKLQVDAGAPQHPLAALTWAAMRLRALEADADLHRAEIARIGRRFGIPTRDTSLIVLETLDDYVRYEIEPPADDLDAWRKRKELLNAGRGAARSKHLDEVVRNFQNRTAWWNTTFPRVPVKAAPVLIQEYSRPVMAAPAPAPSAKMVADAPAGFNRFSSAVDERSNFKPGMLVLQHETMAGQSAPAIGMGLKKWVPNAPYIQRLREADAGTVYAIYLDQKPDYADSSAFYLDAADILLEKGQRDLALRVLSNLAEMDLENRAVLRILGYRLLQANAPQLAVPVFEKVRRLAGEEPQSWRDLGLALAATGRTQEAIDTLYEVVERPWDGRFPDIETIVLAEINAIVAASAKPLDVRRIDPRLRANLPLDLRVVLTWDADNSDMDLWVTAPNGEKSSYQHRLTSQGARMSNDFMGGYGPEEFSLRRAAPGKYRIEANYYGNRQQLVAGATTLQVKLFTAFGTPRQKEQSITLRLKERSETVFVGEFEVKP